jgi:hypothetical protein
MTTQSDQESSSETRAPTKYVGSCGVIVIVVVLVDSGGGGGVFVDDKTYMFFFYCPSSVCV